MISEASAFGGSETLKNKYLLYADNTYAAGSAPKHQKISRKKFCDKRYQDFTAQSSAQQTLQSTHAGGGDEFKQNLAQSGASVKAQNSLMKSGSDTILIRIGGNILSQQSAMQQNQTQNTLSSIENDILQGLTDTKSPRIVKSKKKSANPVHSEKRNFDQLLLEQQLVLQKEIDQYTNQHDQCLLAQLKVQLQELEHKKQIAQNTLKSKQSWEERTATFLKEQGAQRQLESYVRVVKERRETLTKHTSNTRKKEKKKIVRASSANKAIAWEQQFEGLKTAFKSEKAFAIESFLGLRKFKYDLPQEEEKLDENGKLKVNLLEQKTTDTADKPLTRQQLYKKHLKKLAAIRNRLAGTAPAEITAIDSTIKSKPAIDSSLQLQTLKSEIPKFETKKPIASDFLDYALFEKALKQYELQKLEFERDTGTIVPNDEKPWATREDIGDAHYTQCIKPNLKHNQEGHDYLERKQKAIMSLPKEKYEQFYGLTHLKTGERDLLTVPGVELLKNLRDFKKRVPDSNDIHIAIKPVVEMKHGSLDEEIVQVLPQCNYLCKACVRHELHTTAQALHTQQQAQLERIEKQRLKGNPLELLRSDLDRYDAIVQRVHAIEDEAVYQREKKRLAREMLNYENTIQNYYFNDHLAPKEDESEEKKDQLDEDSFFQDEAEQDQNQQKVPKNIKLIITKKDKRPDQIVQDEYVQRRTAQFSKKNIVSSNATQSLIQVYQKHFENCQIDGKIDFTKLNKQRFNWTAK